MTATSVRFSELQSKYLPLIHQKATNTDDVTEKGGLNATILQK